MRLELSFVGVVCHYKAIFSYIRLINNDLHSKQPLCLSIPTVDFGPKVE